MLYITLSFVAGIYWTYTTVLENVYTILLIVFKLTNKPIEIFVILVAINKVNLNEIKLLATSELIFKYETPPLIIFSIWK